MLVHDDAHRMKDPSSAGTQINYCCIDGECLFGNAPLGWQELYWTVMLGAAVGTHAD